MGRCAALLTRNRYFSGGYSENAERVFHFDEQPRASTRLVAKTFPKGQKSLRLPRRSSKKSSMHDLQTWRR